MSKTTDYELAGGEIVVWAKGSGAIMAQLTGGTDSSSMGRSRLDRDRPETATSRVCNGNTR